MIRLIIPFVFGSPMLLVGAMFPQLTWENWKEMLIVYGPMAVGLSWFAFRAENLMKDLKVPITSGFSESNLEVRRMAHRLHGMQKAMLVEVMAHPGTNESARDIAEKMLTQPDDVPPRKKDVQSI